MPASLDIARPQRLPLVRLIRVARPSRLAALAIVLFAVAVAVVPLAASHYGPTIDEGAHIAAGMQWLDQHRYGYEPSTPPLARVADALGPDLAGAHSTSDPDMWHEGDHILRDFGDRERILALARLGSLAFLLLAAVVIWRWSGSLGGDGAAVGALALFLALPPILAHAGLATTDMAAAATFALAAMTAVAWLDQPDLRRSLAFGAAGALMVLSKFTVFLFFPAAMLPITVWRLQCVGRRIWPVGVWARGGAVAVFAAALVVWAGYRFSVGSLLYETALSGQAIAAPHPAQGLASTVAGLPIYPAHEFFRGILDTLRRIGAHHDPVYLLGRVSPGSLWYFFPVDLLVKTPLPFLIAAPIGAVGHSILLYYLPETADAR